MPDSAVTGSGPAVRNPGLALLALEGPDTTAYLEAQSMTALAALEADAVRLCAFADARGRVLSTAYAWRCPGGWRLAVPHDEAEWIRGHLLRFRFRARLEIVVANLALAGLLGARAPSALPAWPAPGRIYDGAGLEIVALHGERRLIAGAPAALERLLAPLRAEVAPDAWTRARLYAGEPEIRAGTRGAFLPQTLGLDTLGALSLRKGCFPGQEIIARAQNRGRIKRRMELLRGDGDAPPGAALELDGVRVTLLDRARLPHGPGLIQVIAPAPLPAALAARRVAVTPPASDARAAS